MVNAEDGDAFSESLFDAVDEPDGEEGMAAEIEEVVLRADVADVQGAVQQALRQEELAGHARGERDELLALLAER